MLSSKEVLHSKTHWNPFSSKGGRIPFQCYLDFRTLNSPKYQESMVTIPGKYSCSVLSLPVQDCLPWLAIL